MSDVAIEPRNKRKLRQRKGVMEETRDKKGNGREAIDQL